MSFPRYPAYKNSGVEWLGEVPSHWRVARLNTIATCNDEVLLESTSEDYEIEYVEISSVQAGTGIVESAILPFGNAPSRARRVVRDGDVLVSTVRTYLRAIVQIKSAPENMIVSTGFAVLRPRRINSGFLGYACQSESFVSEVISRSVGVSYPAINASELARLPLPLPTTLEQTTIATFLDRETAKIDALVAEQKRLIELLKEKRQAVISYAVTKGLDPSVPMKDSGVEWLGEVPAHWEVRSISSISTKITNGYVGPTRDILVDDGVRYLQSLHVKGNKIRFDQPYFVSEEWSLEHSKSILEAGDVLIVQTGDIGQVAVVPPEFAGCNCHALIIVSPIREVLSGDWLASLLNSDYGFHSLLSIQTGALHPHLNCGNVKFLFVPVPPLDEQAVIQRHITASTEKFDDLILEAETAIEILRERRTALISAAVTGQIDVREVVS